MDSKYLVKLPQQIVGKSDDAFILRQWHLDKPSMLAVYRRTRGPLSTGKSKVVLLRRGKSAQNQIVLAHRNHFLARPVRGLAAVGVNMRLTETDFGDEIRSAERLPEVRQEGFVAKPAQLPFLGAIGKDVPYGSSGDRRRCANGGLKQARMEAQNRASIGARPLREKEDRDGEFETFADLGCDLLRARKAGAIDEHGAATARGLAKVGPSTDFGLGDKKTSHDRREDCDVEIAERVGDDDSVGRRLSFDSVMNSERRRSHAAGKLHPFGALLQGKRTAHAGRPVPKEYDCQREAQRHSAPDSAQ